MDLALGPIGGCEGQVVEASIIFVEPPVQRESVARRMLDRWQSRDRALDQHLGETWAQGKSRKGR